LSWFERYPSVRSQLTGGRHAVAGALVSRVGNGQNGGMDREGLIRSLRRSGIDDDRVLNAMRIVPRDQFVDPRDLAAAWEDHPLPIGAGQTISQPYVVAFMTQALRIRPGDNVLDVGTGCGYQAAVLAASGARVHSIEVISSLADHARETLTRLGWGDIEVAAGDGANGWPDAAPFDAILVAAVATAVPPALLEQLRTPDEQTPGGRLILPLTDDRRWSSRERLVLFERLPDDYRRTDLFDVRFVPLVSGT
jgi:protein-L-isoaspartate(D-aspartate) O-methyltransferase